MNPLFMDSDLHGCSICSYRNGQLWLFLWNLCILRSWATTDRLEKSEQIHEVPHTDSMYFVLILPAHKGSAIQIYHMEIERHLCGSIHMRIHSVRISVKVRPLVGTNGWSIPTPSCYRSNTFTTYPARPSRPPRYPLPWPQIWSPGHSPWHWDQPGPLHSINNEQLLTKKWSLDLCRKSTFMEIM